MSEPFSFRELISDEQISDALEQETSNAARNALRSLMREAMKGKCQDILTLAFNATREVIGPVVMPDSETKPTLGSFISHLNSGHILLLLRPDHPFTKRMFDHFGVPVPERDVPHPASGFFNLKDLIEKIEALNEKIGARSLSLSSGPMDLATLQECHAEHMAGRKTMATKTVFTGADFAATIRDEVQAVAALSLSDAADAILCAASHEFMAINSTAETRFPSAGGPELHPAACLERAISRYAYLIHVAVNNGMAPDDTRIEAARAYLTALDHTGKLFERESDGVIKGFQSRDYSAASDIARDVFLMSQEHPRTLWLIRGGWTHDTDAGTYRFNIDRLTLTLKGETTVTKTTEALPTIPSSYSEAVNSVFKMASGMTFDEYKAKMDSALAAATASAADPEEIAALKATIVSLSARPVAPAEFKPASDALPEGRFVMKPAAEVFKELDSGLRKLLTLDVPVWEWEGPNPLVPEIDPSYVFSARTFLPTLLAIVNRESIWLRGPTGSGKSTLVQQIAARLNYMVMRINFDGEVGRLDFIGRDTLESDGKGGTTSKFVEGFLPKAMQLPCIMLLDEIDFCRPEIAASLMPVAESNLGGGFSTPLVITECGARAVYPHPMFCLAATANSGGAGDDTRLYAGVRNQNAALRNRFGGFVDVDYMTSEQEAKMLERKVPSCPEKIRSVIIKIAKEIRHSFKTGDISEVISPRDEIRLATNFVRYFSMTGNEEAAFGTAVEICLLNRARNETERAALSEITQRLAPKGGSR